MRIRVLTEYRAFHVAHFRARIAWCTGDSSAVLAIGTWWMRVHHAAAVDDA